MLMTQGEGMKRKRPVVERRRDMESAKVKNEPRR